MKSQSRVSFSAQWFSLFSCFLFLLFFLASCCFLAFILFWLVKRPYFTGAQALSVPVEAKGYSIPTRLFETYGQNLYGSLQLWFGMFQTSLECSFHFYHVLVRVIRFKSVKGRRCQFFYVQFVCKFVFFSWMFSGKQSVF